jgi:hypothetical protein
LGIGVRDRKSRTGRKEEQWGAELVRIDLETVQVPERSQLSDNSETREAELKLTLSAGVFVEGLTSASFFPVAAA